LDPDFNGRLDPDPHPIRNTACRKAQAYYIVMNYFDNVENLKNLQKVGSRQISGHLVTLA